MRTTIIFISTFLVSALFILFSYSSFLLLKHMGFEYLTELAPELPVFSASLAICIYAFVVQIAAFWLSSDRYENFQATGFTLVLMTSVFLIWTILPKTIDTEIPYDLDGRISAAGTITITLLVCIYLTQKWFWEIGQSHRE